MNSEDDPYRLPTEEKLPQLSEDWWHSWLIDPIKRDDLPAIQRYLAQNPDGLHTVSPSYSDPFIVAAQRPNPGALRLLLEQWAVHQTPGAPPPNQRGSLLFNVACAHGALETVRYLLDEQPALADLHARSTNGYTPILEAAVFLMSCASDEQSEMLAGRAQFDAQAARERVHRSEALLRRLIDKGADVLATTCDRSHHMFGYLFENSGTSRKLMLLHLAAFYGNYLSSQILLEHYAQHGLDIPDIVARRDQFGRLPIHYAAARWPGALGGPDSDSSGNQADIDTDTMALLHILTDSGNRRLINAPDQYSETPLHYALSPNLITGRPAIAMARFLCTDLHASGKLRGRDGETPLHRLWHGRPSSIDTSLAALLLDLEQDRAGDVNAVDDAGNTPLHLATRCLADAPAARFLLSRGADVQTRNKRGRTPLHEAAAGGTLATVEESIRAQDTMLAALCGEEEGLTLEKNWNTLMDEGHVNGKTPRNVAEETRAVWRDEEAERARPWYGTRGGGGGEGEAGVVDRTAGRTLQCTYTCNEKVVRLLW